MQRTVVFAALIAVCSLSIGCGRSGQPTDDPVKPIELSEEDQTVTPSGSEATAAEDERDLSKVTFRIDMYESLARGYLDAARDFLSEAEVDCLAFSGKLITFEIGIRFLADYLSGDVYFETHRPGHNLDRTRTQFEMVRQMEARAEEMSTVVERLR